MTTPNGAPTVRMVGLLRAADGLRNIRAIVTLFVTFLAALLAWALIASIDGAWPKLFGMFVAMGIALIGVSIAGILMLKQLCGITDQPTTLLDGLFVAGRQVVIGLLMLLVAIGIGLVFAVILLVCKIPGIGPILYGVAIPALTIVGAAFYLGMLVAASLISPAVWAGHGVWAALARLYAVARSRPVEALISIFLLGLLCAAIAVILAGAMSVGYAMVMGVSVPILGWRASAGGSGLSSIMDLMFRLQSLTSGGDFNGYAVAGLFGSLTLAAIALPIVIAPWLMGLNIIYQQLSEGLDFGAAETAINQGLQAARDKAAAGQQLARQRAEQMQARAREATAPRIASPPPVAAPNTCPNPQCQQPVTPSDAFCGNCGQRLS